MKKALLLISVSVFGYLNAQLQVDTLAIQDFETVPMTPTWTFTGPVVYNQGYSSATAAPPNSEIGLNGSRAWETTLNSGGLVLDFANIVIPNMYDSIRVKFRLAAMNLTGTSGGPDNLDYVLVAVSTDGGINYYNRLRIRGAVANNSFWPYSATGIAKVYYTPQTEVVFAPTNSGLQTTEGYTFCEITFPGTVTQVQLRMTGRSSTSTDTWLVDNVMITGEYMLVGLQDAFSSGLSVYPNPAKNNLIVELKNDNIDRIEIIDLSGRFVKEVIVCETKSIIPLSELTPGLYFVNVHSGEMMYRKRFVVGK